jgi:hypothetical protein
MNFADDGAHVALREDYYRIDVSEGGQDFGALFGWH